MTADRGCLKIVNIREFDVEKYIGVISISIYHLIIFRWPYLWWRQNGC